MGFIVNISVIMHKRRVIMTSFAGRKSSMSILLDYARALRKLGLVHEFHAWNYTRDSDDEQWLREEFPGREEQIEISVASENFSTVKNVSLRVGSSIILRFKTLGKAKVLLYDPTTVTDLMEIIMCTSICVARKRRIDDLTDSPSLHVKGIHNGEWNEIELKREAISGKITVFINKQEIPSFTTNVPLTSQVAIGIASLDQDHSCTWSIPREYPEKLFEVKNKRSWNEYYSYYADPRYSANSDYILVKCDDDIVFIDPEGFKRFIEVLENDALMKDKYLLVFPNIVNNGLCAFHQQKAQLLPKEKFGEFPYDTFEGRLWQNGDLSQKVHTHFIENAGDWLDACVELSTIKIPIGDRISINFFGIRSDQLADVFGNCGNDDEHDLAVTIPKLLKKPNLLCLNFVVSHLSFFKQRQTGLDENKMVKCYKKLWDKVNKRINSVLDPEVYEKKSSIYEDSIIAA